ncbi:L-arabinose transport system permease protein AraQ [compost metagenome]
MNTKINNPILKLLIWVMLILWSISVLYPLLWTLLDALKDNQQFFLNKPWALPEPPLLWSNFSYVWNKYNFGTYFYNSTIVTICSTGLALLLAASTAYVLARYEFKGSGLLYVLYIASMMVPFVLALTPLFFLINDMGLLNTKLGLILVYAASAVPFGIFVLVGFYKTLPKELGEAASIDGCSDFGTFFRIMLPLSQPGLITVGIMTVLNTWNEFVIGTVLTNIPEKYTLPVGISVMQAEMQYRTEWGPLFAGLLFTIVPILILYIFFQKQIASGITAGAVK